MKTWIFAGMALTGFTLVGPVYAGSDYGSDKSVKNVVSAEAAPSLYNWTGFYVGAQGGYSYGSFDPDLTLGGDWSTVPADRTAIEDARRTRLLNADGGSLGGLLGYNYQINHWVFGLEADGSYLWLRNFRDSGIFTVPATGDAFSVRNSFKTHYLATVGPRVGYAFGRFLPYVTGGLAVGDLDFAQEIDQHNAAFKEGGSHSRTNAGWMVGGGLQYGITDYWSVRAQYQYDDLGNEDFNTRGTGPNQGFTGTSKASLLEHNATIALMFKF
jgi:outer membrane immunogenic protein